MARHEGDKMGGPLVGRKVDCVVGYHSVHRDRVVVRSGTERGVTAAEVGEGGMELRVGCRIRMG